MGLKPTNLIRFWGGMALIPPLFCALETAKSPFLLLKIPISPGFWCYIPFCWLKINVLKSETKKSVSLSQIEARPALYVVCDCKRPKR